MSKNNILILLILIFFNQLSMAQENGKQYVILDTDIGPDYDDVGALAMLHTMADKGETELLATISCNHHFLSGPTMHLLNTYLGRPNIPIGVPSSMGLSLTSRLKWPQLLMEKYPHKYNSNDNFSNAVSVYRKVLSEAQDNSVVIIAIGFFTNLSDLLNSDRDKFSELSGRDLIAKKVNRLVSMAGKFPEGREYNVYMDTISAQNVVHNWPTKILFSGWEIGNEIKTGLRLIANKKLVNSPVKDVYVHSIPQRPIDSLGRMSWDQTAVLVGVRGAEPFFNTKRGTFVVGNNGNNYWKNDGNGLHFYLTKKMNFDQIGDLIEDLMTR